MNWKDRHVLDLPMPFIRDSFDPAPPADRFYCLATGKATKVSGSYVGLMAPNPTVEDLPVVVVAAYGNPIGVKVRPSDF